MHGAICSLLPLSLNFTYILGRCLLVRNFTLFNGGVICDRKQYLQCYGLVHELDEGAALKSLLPIPSLVNKLSDYLVNRSITVYVIQ